MKGFTNSVVLRRRGNKKNPIMTTHTCFSLCFFYITTFHLAISTLAQYDNYNIHMDISPMPKAISFQHTWYLSTFSWALDNSKATTNKYRVFNTSSIKNYTVRKKINFKWREVTKTPKEQQSSRIGTWILC